MSDSGTVVSLVLHKPQRISEVSKWADQAFALDFPDDSPVEVRMTGELVVRAYLDQTGIPGSGDDS